MADIWFGVEEGPFTSNSLAVYEAADGKLAFEVDEGAQVIRTPLAPPQVADLRDALSKWLAHWPPSFPRAVGTGRDTVRADGTADTRDEAMDDVADAVYDKIDGLASFSEIVRVVAAIESTPGAFDLIFAHRLVRGETQ